MKRPSTSDPFDPATIQISGCQGKEAFPSRQAARTVADRRRQRAKNPFNNHKQAKKQLAGLHPFQCSHCGRWHLGGRKQ